MKKAFLIVAILLAMAFAVFNLTNTQDINTDNLIGYWKPNKESSQLFFWKDNKGRIQVQEINGTNGEPIDAVDFKIYNNCFLIKTIFKSNNWIANSKYVFINDTILSCIVYHPEGTTELIYTKTK